MAISRLRFQVLILAYSAYLFVVLMALFHKGTHHNVIHEFIADAGVRRAGVSEQTDHHTKHLGPDKVIQVLIIGYSLHNTHTLPVHCDCQGMKFILSNDSSKIREADIFTLGAQRNMTLDDWRHYHRERDPSQIWVLGSRESPQTCTAAIPPSDMVDVYNWSFTYHSEADFPTPYGWFNQYDSSDQLPEPKNWFATKKKLIMWTSSDCPLPTSKYQRRDFVKALGKHINVSMFGTCGDGKHLPKHEYIEQANDHKFVLALENSCCSEYITEKFWDALTQYGQVPVVYGATRGEYERVAPPDSFIFVQDFETLTELATYIRRLGENEDEYNKYHYWRRLRYTMKQSIIEDRVYRCYSACRFAKKLRGADHKQGKKYSFDVRDRVYQGGCRICQREIDVLLNGG